MSVFYFGGYFTTSSDAPESDVWQQNGRPPETTQAQPQYNPGNTVAELTSDIFSVTTTLPQPNTDYNIILPPTNNNNNNSSTPSTEKETQPSTQAPTQPSTTEAENDIDVETI